MSRRLATELAEWALELQRVGGRKHRRAGPFAGRQFRHGGLHRPVGPGARARTCAGARRRPRPWRGRRGPAVHRRGRGDPPPAAPVRRRLPEEPRSRPAALPGANTSTGGASAAHRSSNRRLPNARRPASDFAPIQPLAPKAAFAEFGHTELRTLGEMGEALARSRGQRAIGARRRARRRRRHRRRRCGRRRTVPDLRGRRPGADARSCSRACASGCAGPPRPRPRRRACARCTPSRAARAWPARCAWARWRTAWKPQSNTWSAAATPAPPTSNVWSAASMRSKPASTCCAAARSTTRSPCRWSRNRRPSRPLPCRRPTPAAAPLAPLLPLPVVSTRAEPVAEPAPVVQAAVEPAAPVVQAQPAAAAASPNIDWSRFAAAGAGSAVSAGQPARRPAASRPCACARSCSTAWSTRPARSVDHAFAHRGRCRAAEGLARRPDRQPGAPAPPAARHRAAGRDADHLAHGGRQGLGGRRSTRWRWTASRASRN